MPIPAHTIVIAAPHGGGGVTASSGFDAAAPASNLLTPDFGAPAFATAAAWAVIDMAQSVRVRFAGLAGHDGGPGRRWRLRASDSQAIEDDAWPLDTGWMPAIASPEGSATPAGRRRGVMWRQTRNRLGASSALGGVVSASGDLDARAVADDIPTRISTPPAVVLDLRGLRGWTPGAGWQDITTLTGFAYTRAGRTTVYRDGETRIVDANQIPVGDMGYAPQPATTQLLAVDPLDLTTANSVSTTIADLGPLQIFRRVSVSSQGGSAAASRVTASFAAVAGQPFSVQWYFQAGSSGQALLEALNLDSLGFGFIRGSIGSLAITREDATFGSFSDFRVERLAGGVWRVSATVTPAETATYRIGIGPNSATVGEDIIALAMSAQDEATPTALIPDASRGGDGGIVLTDLQGMDPAAFSFAAATRIPYLPPDFAWIFSVALDSNERSDLFTRPAPETAWNARVQDDAVQTGNITLTDARGSQIVAGRFAAGGMALASSENEFSVDATATTAESADTIRIGANSIGASEHPTAEIGWIAFWDGSLSDTDIRRLRMPGRALAEIGGSVGATVTLAADVAPADAAAQPALQAEWWDSDGGRLGQDEVAGAAGADTRLALQATAPAGAAFFRPRISLLAGGAALVSRAMLEPGVTTGDYDDPMIYRFWRLDVDGAMSIGRLILSEGFQPSRNMDVGYSKGVADQRQPGRTPFGAPLASPGAVLDQADIRLRFLSRAEMEDGLLAIRRKLGDSGAVMVLLDPTSERLHSDTIHGRITARGLQNRAYNIFEARIRIEEVA